MPMRRTIVEWTTLLEVEPALRVVFVEGDADQWLIAALFQSLNAVNVSVVKICEATVPARLIPNTPFSSGNRARLLALASTVEVVATRPVHNLRCVVDRDCATILPVANESQYVRFTDGANLLIQFAAFKPIQHALGAVYGPQLSADDYCAITDAAQFLFAVRVVTYGCYPDATRVDSYSSLALVKDQLLFDRSEYIKRFALANSLARERKYILDQANALCARFGGDVRKYMNYHDFLALLYGGLKRRRFVRAGVSQTELGRVFLATINVDRMVQDPFLKELCTWAGVK